MIFLSIFSTAPYFSTNSGVDSSYYVMNILKKRYCLYKNFLSMTASFYSMQMANCIVQFFMHFWLLAYTRNVVIFLQAMPEAWTWRHNCCSQVAVKPSYQIIWILNRQYYKQWFHKKFQNQTILKMKSTSFGNTALLFLLSFQSKRSICPLKGSANNNIWYRNIYLKRFS